MHLGRPEESNEDSFADKNSVRRRFLSSAGQVGHVDHLCMSSEPRLAWILSGSRLAARCRVEGAQEVSREMQNVLPLALEHHAHSVAAVLFRNDEKPLIE